VPVCGGVGGVARGARAVALDPGLLTSVTWTYFRLGDYEKAIEADRGSPPFCALLARILRGQMTIDMLRQVEAGSGSPGTRLALSAYRALFEGRVDQAVNHLEALRASGLSDPEGWFIYALCLARAGAPTPALELLTRAVDGGYACHESLSERPEWARLRGTPAFDALVERTASMAADARARFNAADGAAVLAPPPPSSRGA
jgi:hypothetical protein